MADAGDIARREQYIESALERIADLEAEVLKWQVEAGKFGPGMEAMEDLLREAQREFDDERQAHLVCIEMRNDAEAQRDRLWASLARYGNHASDCMMYRRDKCDCGWPELKKIIVNG